MSPLPPPPLLDPRQVRHLCNWAISRAEAELAQCTNFNRTRELELVIGSARQFIEWVESPRREKP